MNAVTTRKPFCHENDQLLFQAQNVINEEHSVTHLLRQAVNLPVGHLVSQEFMQLVVQSPSQSVSQSAILGVSWSFSQSVSYSGSQLVSQFISQSHSH